MQRPPASSTVCLATAAVSPETTTRATRAMTRRRRRRRRRRRHRCGECCTHRCRFRTFASRACLRSTFT